MAHSQDFKLLPDYYNAKTEQNLFGNEVSLVCVPLLYELIGQQTIMTN
jgi:hypothetical protein